MVLNYENPEEYVARSLLNLMGRDEWLKQKGRIRLVGQDKLPKTLTTQYLSAVTEGLPPGMLAVDTVMAAMAPQFARQSGGSYTPEIVAAALQPLLEWSHESGWTLVGLHHFNKSGSTSCSYEFRARPDVLWEYEGEGTAVRTLRFSGRLLRVPDPIMVGWDNDQGAVNLVTDPKTDTTPLRDRILGLLPTDPAGAMTKEEIGEELTVSQKPVRVTLEQLEDSHEVAHEQRGKSHANCYWRLR